MCDPSDTQGLMSKTAFIVGASTRLVGWAGLVPIYVEWARHEN